MPQEILPPTHSIKSREQTTCCVVGAGPAGAILSFMLARKGIPVMLLESHLDFDRDFRGDTLHPSILEVMDELGLADRLLQLPHTKLSQVTVPTPTGPRVVLDLSHLKTKFPYVAFMPQSRFLAFITGEAQCFPSFQLVMGAHVEELIEEGGQVRGVRYRGRDGWHEARALLTIGSDGRFSRLRRLAGFEPIKSLQPMDVLWFRLPRKPDDPRGLMGRFGRGHILGQIERGEQWQVIYIIAKGSYRQVRAAGLEALRHSIVETAPELADRVAVLTNWQQIPVLSVEADRLPRWYRPGLLLIGDAAHVMSPAGGNGINYAIMDAVEAANLLTAPLQAGEVTVADLARIQRRREWPTRIIQAMVNLLQDRLLKAALDPTSSFTFPSFLGWPLVRKVIPQLFAFGIRPEHVQQQARRRPTWFPVGIWITATIVVLALAWIIRRLTRRS